MAVDLKRLAELMSKSWSWHGCSGGASQVDLTTIFEALAAKGVEIPDGATVNDIDELINGIQTGGGGSAAVIPKEVNFYDYDGTLLHAYTVAEAQALTALPDGPQHPGLVFQGWNWSLEGVKGLTRAMNIGAMYITDDGTTRLYITLQEGRTSPMLGICVNGTVTVEWGDGTEPDVLTGTSVDTTQWTPNHAYAKPGDYVIRLTVDGEMAFTGANGANLYACLLRHASTTDTRNGAYQNSITRAEIGTGVTNIGKCAFSNCYSLKSVIVPDGITEILDYAFSDCYSLNSVIIPDGVENVGMYAFADCRGLRTIIIPANVTYYKNYCFSNCYSLDSVIIPDGVETIGSSVFQNCRGISSVIVFDKSFAIGSSAFSNCTGVAYYDFTSCDAVPALSSTTSFSSIPSDCEIRVPAALYDKWIAATNWATYAANIKAY